MRRTEDDLDAEYAVRSLDDATFSFSRIYSYHQPELDTEIRRVLYKRVLENRGGWATICFVYVQRYSSKQEFGRPRFALEKWYKRGSYWRRRTSIRIRAEDMEALLQLAADWGLQVRPRPSSEDEANVSDVE